MQNRRRMARPSRRDERGSGVVLAATTLVAVLIALWVAAIAVSYMEAQHRARSAADLAALAAVGASQAQGHGCEMAATIARSNSADLVSCQLQAGAVGEQAIIVAAAQPSLVLPGLPETIEVEARAEARSEDF